MRSRIPSNLERIWGANAYITLYLLDFFAHVVKERNICNLQQHRLSMQNVPQSTANQKTLWHRRGLVNSQCQFTEFTVVPVSPESTGRLLSSFIEETREIQSGISAWRHITECDTLWLNSTKYCVDSIRLRLIERQQQHRHFSYWKWNNKSKTQTRMYTTNPRKQFDIDDSKLNDKISNGNVETNPENNSNIFHVLQEKFKGTNTSERTLEQLHGIVKNLDLSSMTNRGKYVLVKKMLLESLTNDINGIENPKASKGETTIHEGHIRKIEPISFNNYEERQSLKRCLQIENMKTFNQFIHTLNRAIRKLNLTTPAYGIQKKKRSDSNPNVQHDQSRIERHISIHGTLNQGEVFPQRESLIILKRASMHEILSWLEDKFDFYSGKVKSISNLQFSVTELLDLLQESELREIMNMTGKHNRISLQRHLMYILQRPKSPITLEKKQLIENYLLKKLESTKEPTSLHNNSSFKLENIWKDQQHENQRISSLGSIQFTSENIPISSLSSYSIQFSAIRLKPVEIEELSKITGLTKFQTRYVINQLQDPPRELSSDEIHTINSWIQAKFGHDFKPTNQDKIDMMQRFKISRKQLNRMLRALQK